MINMSNLFVTLHCMIEVHAQITPTIKEIVPNDLCFDIEFKVYLLPHQKIFFLM